TQPISASAAASFKPSCRGHCARISSVLRGGPSSPVTRHNSSVMNGVNGCSSFKISSSTQAVDRKSTRLNSSHGSMSYAVLCLKKRIHPSQEYRLSATLAMRQTVPAQVTIVPRQLMANRTHYFPPPVPLPEKKLFPPPVARTYC